MKMTKKLLLAAAVMMVASFGFMGCGPDDDDPYGIVNGSNNDYYVGESVDVGYTNTSTETQRGYDTTTFKHAGGLVKVTFKDFATVAVNSELKAPGVMGLMWNLEETKASDSNPVDFYIAGVRCKSDGTVQGYVSKYEHVTNTQAYNFGAPVDLTEGDGTNGSTQGTKETEIVPFDGTTKLSADANGDASVWIYVAPNASTAADSKDFDGTFTVKVLKAEPEIEEVEYTTDGGSKVKQYEVKASSINASDVLFEGKTNDTKEGGVSRSDIQKKLGVYANVYQGGNLRGTWTFNNTFYAAEVIEDAE